MWSISSSLVFVCALRGLGFPDVTLDAPEEGFNEIRFSPDGKMLAGDMRRLDCNPLMIWDMQTGKSRGPIGADFRRRKVFGRFAFSPDSKVTASFYPQNPVRLWDLAEKKILEEFDVGEEGAFGGAFTPDGKTLIVLAQSGILFWDLEAKKKVASIPGKDYLGGLTLSADGMRLAASGGTGLYVHDVAKRKLIQKIKHPATGGKLKVVTLSPDGKHMAAVEPNLQVHLWDTDSGELLSTIDVRNWKNACALTALAFSPDSKTVAIGGKGRIYWAIVENWTVYAEWAYPVDVMCLAISPDGKTLAAGCADKTVKLFAAPKPKTDDEIYKK
jgi:WD40 repeat protein